VATLGGAGLAAERQSASRTLDDRALLAQFSAKAFDSDPIKKMRID